MKLHSKQIVTACFMVVGTFGSLSLAAGDEPAPGSTMATAQPVETVPAEAGVASTGGLAVASETSAAIRFNPALDAHAVQGHGGSMVVETLLKRYGIHTQAKDIALGTSRSAFGLGSMYDVHRVLDERGLAGNQASCSPQQLVDLTAAHDVIGQLADDRFFVLIESIDDESVTFTHAGWAILDQRPHVLSREQFDQSWAGPCLVISGRK